MQPIIFHLDMNSYFATAEQQNNPAWRGKPLGVCEHLGGIIIAASIEAKRWGIKTGTPVWEARKLYPKIIFTKTHPDLYRRYIKGVLGVASDYTDLVEQASIDEMYLDLTKACNVRNPKYEALNSKQTLNSKFKIQNPEMVDPFEEAVSIAREIKRRMKLEVGDYLTCSIGIADNKLVAKIGSDMKKPDGLVVVLPYVGQAPGLLVKQGTTLPYSKDCLVFSKNDLYEKLKLTDIPGIAKRTEKSLNKLGIKTLLDLKNYPVSLLVTRFGINGYHLHQMGQLSGSWKPNVEQSRLSEGGASKESGIKSIGHMYTLPMEFREKKFFVPVLYKLCEMVAKRLRKQGLMGNIIHFHFRPSTNFYINANQISSLENKSKKIFNLESDKIGDGVKDKNYQGYGESKKLGFCVYDGREIFLQAMEIYAQVSRQLVFESTGAEIKLIGITVAGLRPYAGQLSLFGHEERLKSVTQALDKINAKYGDFTLCRLPVLKAKGVFKDSIGFGRIKEK